MDIYRAKVVRRGDHHELFEVSAKGPRYQAGRDYGTWDKSHQLIATLRADERLLSLGGTISTVARKVSPAQVRRGLSAFP